MVNKKMARSDGGKHRGEGTKGKKNKTPGVFSRTARCKNHKYHLKVWHIKPFTIQLWGSGKGGQKKREEVGNILGGRDNNPNSVHVQKAFTTGLNK